MTEFDTLHVRFLRLAPLRETHFNDNFQSRIRVEHLAFGAIDSQRRERDVTLLPGFQVGQLAGGRHGGRAHRPVVPASLRIDAAVELGRPADRRHRHDADFRRPLERRRSGY